MPSPGVVRMDNEKSFVVADIPGLIEGAAEGAGLGIRFLKHLERCRVLLHLIDIDPIDGSDPVENARIIIGELEKYSEKLASKPRWLVFNKIDLMDKAEAEAKAKAIAEALGWEEILPDLRGQPAGRERAMLGRDDLHHRKPDRAGGRRAEAGESRVYVGRLSPSAA